MPDEGIERVLRAGLSFLENEGFSFVEVRCTESELTGDFYSVTYRSESARRQVRVAYFPRRDSAIASIRDTDRPFDWSDAGAMYVRVPEFQRVPGEGVEKLSAYLSALRDLLLRDFGNVLRGAPMKNDAFDWSPYK